LPNALWRAGHCANSDCTDPQFHPIATANGRQADDGLDDRVAGGAKLRTIKGFVQAWPILLNPVLCDATRSPKNPNRSRT